MYDLLGVDSSVSGRGLKAAYRRLAKELHPDTNPDPAAGARFREVARAYSVLSDPVARVAYDEVRGRGGGLLSGVPHDSELFREAFRGVSDPWLPVSTPGGVRRGKDFLGSVTVGLETAVRGGVVPFLLTAEGPCGHCSGSGVAGGGLPEVCASCTGSGGSGGVRCASCGGSGVRVTDPCTGCAGSGLSMLTRTVKIELPSGFVDGGRIRVAGAGGAAGRGGQPGDLFVDVKVAEHPLFERDGNHLRVSVGVPLQTAVAGGGVQVPLLFGGSARLRIPAGTVPGQVFRLAGRGLPLPGPGAGGGGGRPGDLFVRVRLAGVGGR